MIVTIDGPAGSGKSTAARELAKALGIAFLDTGATYRAVTWEALRCGTDLEDEGALVELARRLDIRFVPAGRDLRVLLGGRDVTREIRSEEVSAKSHHAAGSAAVREVLVELQRRLGRGLGSFVAEGRDQGSVVFPEADVKFYLDARAEVRARRRHEELLAGGRPSDYEEVLESMRRRDARDRSRPVAPLIEPEGAIAIDTSEMSIQEVVEELRRHVEAAG
jgi:cytidylate kinase